MTCCPPEGDETFLMPLKKRKHFPCPGYDQSVLEKGCEMVSDKCGAPKPRRRNVCTEEVDDPEPVTCPEPCFEDSVEWQSTKCMAAGLFRALGQHYDQPWFPTVVNEWSALYYQCNHAADYWCARDEWLAGDEEVRLAVWSEVLRHREHHERQLDQLNRNVLCDTGKCNPKADLMDVHDGCNAEVMENHGCLNVACDRFDLPHKNIEQFSGKDLPSNDEKARAEAEAAEIALADPDDNPDWVQMRRQMRNSFAALNMAQCEVSAELLDHIMIELCKYWANASISEHSCSIDPQLERNIMREIHNFRFKLFGVAVEIEPELKKSGPDEYQESEPSRKLKSCRKQELRREPEFCRTPEPCQKPEPRHEPNKCSLKELDLCCPREPEPCCSPEQPCQKPEPCCPRKPELFCPLGPEGYCSQEPVQCCPPPPLKPKCCAVRRSSKTKMAEARARHNATQVRDRDITTGWLGGRPNP